MTDRISRIVSVLPTLSTAQINSIESLVNQFSRPYIYKKANINSDIVSESFLEDFGDMLRLHHCFSKGPFSKDKFEFALEQAFVLSGRNAVLASTGNPTYDLSVEDEKYSLKTEASKNVRLGKIHISKFMELGKGLWTDKVEHLAGLRDSFIERLNNCDRILTLRKIGVNPWTYELVEIPVKLLKLASSGNLEMNHSSKQMPKPGYCNVYEGNDLSFQLYFDGGTERKLQIKNLKKSLCIVHATWTFEITSIIPDSQEE